MKKLFLILFIFLSGICFSQTMKNRLKPDTGIAFLTSHPSRLESTLFKDRDSVRIFFTQTSADDFHQIGMAVKAKMDDQWIERGIIIGQGVGGAPVGNNASSSQVFKISDTYFCFALEGYGFPGDSRAVFGYKSIGNPYSWQALADTIFTIDMVVGIVGYGNTTVWPEKVSGKYHALVEAFTLAGIWETYHAESTEIETGWAITHKVASMQISGMYGGSCLKRYNGVWHIFYHYGISGGNTPTYIAYAQSTSDNIATVTIKEYPIAIYYYKIFDIGVTQIADPWIEEIDGKVYHTMELTVNSSPTLNQPRMQTFNGPFYKFIQGL